MLKNIATAQAGRYRTVDVKIAGARHDPPPHYRIAEQMAEFTLGVITGTHTVAMEKVVSLKRHPSIVSQPVVVPMVLLI